MSAYTPIEKPKFVKVTKNFLTKFRNYERLKADRPLSENRLRIYRSILGKGEFRPCDWAVCYCEETGQWYMLNGNHTSTLLSEYDELPEFYVTFYTYRVRTLEDCARLWSTFDSAKAARNSKEIIYSFAGTVKVFDDVPRKALTLSVAALSYDRWNNLYKKANPADRAELLLEETDFVLWLGQLMRYQHSTHHITGRTYPSHVFRQAPVSAMYDNYKRSKSDATKFWELVLSEEAPTNDDGSRVLAKWLGNVGARSGFSTSRRSTEIVGFKNIYVNCLKCWNSWRVGKPVTPKMMKFDPKEKIPKSI